MGDSSFILNGTASFMGKRFELGRFDKDYMCLKDLWDSAMHEVLGLEALVGEKFRQEVEIPWSDEVREIQNDAALMDVLSEFEQRKVNKIHFNVDYIPLVTVQPNQQPNNNPIQQPTINLTQQSNYNLNQQPNIEQEPIILTDLNQQPNNNPIQQPNNILTQQPTINLTQQSNYNLNQQPNIEQEPVILTDSSSSPIEDDANYNSDGSSYQSTINSDDGVPNDASEDEVPNDASEDEVPNDNDSADENDGLSDINEDDIADEEVVDQPIMGTAFRTRNDGRITLEVGQLFRNSTHFREILLDYSIQEGFKLKRIKNEKRRITVGCEAQGCHWRVHGSPTFDRVTYMLKTLRNDHNCLAVPKNRDVTSVWLGKRFQVLIKENPNIHIRVLGSVILRQCGVEVPDHKLYRAKRYALNIGDEDHKQSYNKLYKYGHIIMERNPVSYVKLMTIRKNPNPQVPANFQRFYLSFQAQKVGYLQGCRPFIGLDGCHLKGPYGGVILCAIAIDANCGVYPIALGVVEIECLDSWRWFLELLHQHVGVHDSRRVCFMTDRQKGIMPALDEVWPNHNSRFCGRHILQNMLGRFKIDYLKDLFWPAATSPNKVAFLQAMDEIKQASPEAHDYLNGIPLETWAVHAFDTICKTDHNTNNVVEAFNGWMNKHRTLPMLTMMETVRKKFMKHILSRYEAAVSWESNVPPKINRRLQKAQKEGRYLDLLRCGEYEFEISDGNRQFIVELDKRSCQCGIWVISGVPCKHAMACITKKRDNVEDYVDVYLKKAAYLRTYSNNIHAIPDNNLWPNGNFETVLPPIRRRGAGRPKLSRNKGSNEPKRVQRSIGFRCGICKEVGHNSRTCKNTSTTEAASTSTAPSRPHKATKRKRNEGGSSSTYPGAAGAASTHPGAAGAASTHTEPDSTHPRHASTHPRHASRTNLSGSSTIATSPRISGTVTRVLWFPSTQEGTSTPRDTTNCVSSQPLTQGAPQPSQQSQP